VKLTCQQTPAGQTVSYPAGQLYVGLSLYKLPANVRQAVAPLKSENNEGAYHADAQEIPRPATSVELTFRLPSNLTQTHMLLAVWDQKNECSDDGRCGALRYTLGKVDRNENPIPVDAWPVPVCNVATLQARGFFAWSQSAEWETPGEDGDMMSLARLNDCWMRDSTWPGRGLSYRQWRVAPLPR
jgi:hypothetical protein